MAAAAFPVLVYQASKHDRACTCTFKGISEELPNSAGGAIEHSPGATPGVSSHANGAEARRAERVESKFFRPFGASFFSNDSTQRLRAGLRSIALRRCWAT